MEISSQLSLGGGEWKYGYVGLVRYLSLVAREAWPRKWASAREPSRMVLPSEPMRRVGTREARSLGKKPSGSGGALHSCRRCAFQGPTAGRPSDEVSGMVVSEEEMEGDRGGL